MPPTFTLTVTVTLTFTLMMHILCAWVGWLDGWMDAVCPLHKHQFYPTAGQLLLFYAVYSSDCSLFFPACIMSYPISPPFTPSSSSLLPQDFCLPPSWTAGASGGGQCKPLRIPPFRLLAKNRYPPSLRPSQLFPHDPAPPCVCSRATGGCGDSCQNFQLLM